MDRILGAEEIVVEPLHPGFGSLPIYAGATVLGDGEIALILDAQGLCRHAGLQPVDLGDSKVGNQDGAEEERLLLFRSGPDEQIGLRLSALRRVVRIGPEQIERSGGGEYIQLDGGSVRIERLENRMPVSASAGSGDGYLLLPSGSDGKWGLFASALVDSGEYRFRADTEGTGVPLVRQAAILRGRRTLILDDAVLGETAGGDP